MGVFRVEKNRGYTVMSNYHLKDKNISLKAKGLLSMILSLPDGWNYTTRGLAAISKEGVESIGTTLKELEKVGYLDRKQVRDEMGRIRDVEYTIYEQPKKKEGKEKATGKKQPGTDKPDAGSPDTDSPDTGNPDMDNPDTGEPDTENPPQLNTNQIKTHKSNTHGSNSYPYQSNHMDGYDSTEPPVRAWNLELMIGHVQAEIDYFNLREELPITCEQLDEMIGLIAEMRCKQSGTVNIGGTVYTADAVRERFEKITGRHIRYVAEAMNNNRTKIHNIRKYLIAALFNAPATVSNYYRAEFNHKYGDDDLLADVE